MTTRTKTLIRNFSTRTVTVNRDIKNTIKNMDQWMNIWCKPWSMLNGERLKAPKHCKYHARNRFQTPNCYNYCVRKCILVPWSTAKKYFLMQINFHFDAQPDSSKCYKYLATWGLGSLGIFFWCKYIFFLMIRRIFFWCKSFFLDTSPVSFGQLFYHPYYLKSEKRGGG